MYVPFSFFSLFLFRSTSVICNSYFLHVYGNLHLWGVHLRYVWKYIYVCHIYMTLYQCCSNSVICNSCFLHVYDNLHLWGVHLRYVWKYIYVSHIYMTLYQCCSNSVNPNSWFLHTGWTRLIGSPKLLIIFHKRATKYRSLWRK